VHKSTAMTYDFIVRSVFGTRDLSLSRNEMHYLRVKMNEFATVCWPGHGRNALQPVE